jgi:ribonucleoside-diphosphate reductase alpha chain
MTAKRSSATRTVTHGKRQRPGRPPVASPVPLSDTACRVLAARYLRRDAEGDVAESPAQLFRRVARAVAHAELLLGGDVAAAARWEDRFHAALAGLEFLPNSPALMNAGTPMGQLAACFVLPVEDTMEGIFGSLRAMALVQRTGGGTGFSFSRLRPRGARLRSTGGEASGPVSFLRIFDAATEHIRLGGRRRGANMAVLAVAHPDVLEFVDAKRDGCSLTNFNLSVAVGDAFMQAVERGDPYRLSHPAAPSAGRLVAAREIFDRIVDAAWTTGDPGLLFADAMERDNPTPAAGALESTNPCGEVPLLPWESCVLGAVNLARMLRADGADVDWDRLRRTVHLAVRFLDDLIEVSREPLPEIGPATRANRKIGVGVMGFAELLIRLGVSYADDAADAWADRLAAFIAAQAHAASQELAGSRGVFPNWSESMHARCGTPRRNATCVSIAPTGTLSLIAGTSAGIEPLFALAYRRAHTLGGGPLVELNPVFARAAAQLGADAARIRAAVERSGTLADVAGVPAALRRLFATALELSPQRHLRIQRAFQRHVDNAVAKTINLPETATRADVAAIYRSAWTLGLKGVTVYRYGSKDQQVLTLGTGEEPAARELFARCDPAACRL